MKPSIKILKSGKSLSSTDIRDYLFHSDFSMLKYHMDNIVTMTINAGDTETVATLNHGLGYVPEFMVYRSATDGIFEIPDRIVTYSIDHHYFAYADSTKIYIKYKTGQPHLLDQYSCNDGYSNVFERDWMSIGNYGDPLGTFDCALRFGPVNITRTESISSAYMQLYVGSKGTSDDVKFTVRGIDEDNTGDFGSYPLGRTLTDATSNQTQASSSTPFTFNVNVLSQLNEIRQRTGWSSGNNLAFFMNNNNTNSGAYFMGYSSDSSLFIQKSGSTTEKFRVIVFKDKIA